MNYTVKLPVFEGPFDLLFHLVKKAELDIWEVSVFKITEQYLAYLQSMKELDLDIASEFLVMAATLLRLKSKLLLPRPQRPAEEEDEIYNINTPEELFNRLEEYRRIKEAAFHLKDQEKEQQKIFLRSTSGKKTIIITQQQNFYTFWEGSHLLGEIMRRFAESVAASAIVPVIGGIDDLNLAAKMTQIITALQRCESYLSLRALAEDQTVFWDLIVVFIAVLELARQKKILFYQDRPFGQIFLALNRAYIKEQEMEQTDGA